jgi:hypothetical protein
MQKASSNVLSFYFSATSPRNKRLVWMELSNQDLKFPEEYRKFAVSQDGRAKESIAGNGSGVDETRGRSRGTDSQKQS